MTEEDRSKLRVYVAEMANALEDSDIGQCIETIQNMCTVFELGEPGALVEDSPSGEEG